MAEVKKSIVQELQSKLGTKISFVNLDSTRIPDTIQTSVAKYSKRERTSLINATTLVTTYQDCNAFYLTRVLSDKKKEPQIISTAVSHVDPIALLTSIPPYNFIYHHGGTLRLYNYETTEGSSVKDNNFSAEDPALAIVGDATKIILIFARRFRIFLIEKGILGKSQDIELDLKSGFQGVQQDFCHLVGQKICVGTQEECQVWQMRISEGKAERILHIQKEVNAPGFSQIKMRYDLLILVNPTRLRLFDTKERSEKRGIRTEKAISAIVVGSGSSGLGHTDGSIRILDHKDSSVSVIATGVSSTIGESNLEANRINQMRLLDIGNAKYIVSAHENFKVTLYKFDKKGSSQPLQAWETQVPPKEIRVNSQTNELTCLTKPPDAPPQIGVWAVRVQVEDETRRMASMADRSLLSNLYSDMIFKDKESHSTEESQIDNTVGFFGVDLNTIMERPNEKDFPQYLKNLFEQLLHDGVWYPDITKPNLCNLQNVKTIMKHMEAGESVQWDQIEGHDAFEVLRNFLEYLPQPLIVFPNYPDWLKAAQLPLNERAQKSRELFDDIGLVQKNIASQLLCFFYGVSKNFSTTNMTTGMLGLTFYDLCFRPAQNKKSLDQGKFSLLCRVLIETVGKEEFFKKNPEPESAPEQPKPNFESIEKLQQSAEKLEPNIALPQHSQMQWNVAPTQLQKSQLRPNVVSMPSPKSQFQSSTEKLQPNIALPQMQGNVAPAQAQPNQSGPLHTNKQNNPAVSSREDQDFDNILSDYTKILMGSKKEEEPFEVDLNDLEPADNTQLNEATFTLDHLLQEVQSNLHPQSSSYQPNHTASPQTDGPVDLNDIVDLEGEAQYFEEVTPESSLATSFSVSLDSLPQGNVIRSPEVTKLDQLIQMTGFQLLNKCKEIENKITTGFSLNVIQALSSLLHLISTHLGSNANPNTLDSVSGFVIPPPETNSLDEISLLEKELCIQMATPVVQLIQERVQNLREQSAQTNDIQVSMRIANQIYQANNFSL